jgi:hypothetical protein
VRLPPRQVPEPGDTYVRDFRVVGLPYKEPDAHEGVLTSGNAEKHLRTQLESGGLPESAALVAPERGCIVGFNPGATFEFLFAWRNHESQIVGSQFFRRHYRYFGGLISAWADLEVEEYMQDPEDELWAAGGSVLIMSGRMARLNLYHWLRPVAEILANTYQVEVAVYPAEATPPPPVWIEEPWVVNGVEYSGAEIEAMGHAGIAMLGAGRRVTMTAIVKADAS